MSQADSPSITQYFKAQRKRARAGKDGDLLSSKKLLMEDGNATEEIKKEKKAIKVVENKRVLVQKDELEDTAERTSSINSPADVEKRKKKKATGVKKSSKGKSTGTAAVKISVYAKPATASSSSTKISKEKTEKQPDDAGGEEEGRIVQSKEMPEVEAAAPEMSTTKDDTVQPLSSSSGNSNKEIRNASDAKPAEALPVSVAGDAEETVQNSSPSTSVQSPVKFSKVGSLSPIKKNKMTKAEIAKLLKKKTTLNELKKSLAGINQCAQKLTEFRRTVAEGNAKSGSPAKAPKVTERAISSLSVSSPPNKSTNAIKQGISPAQFYSPSAADRIRSDLERLSATKASPSKLLSINIKAKKRLFDEKPSEGDKKQTVPAYQRFHSLAQKSPAEKDVGAELELPLPYNFKVMKELFIAVDTVLGIMKTRKETMIFPKVRAGVQELFKKVSLREKHLAQMVTILPGCFSFGLQKVGKETVIRIDVEDLPPSVICERRKRFHSALIKICLEHHQKFLLGLVPPIVVPADKKITRWHPLFKIDEIPDIESNENALPAKPAPEKISTAREVIAKAQNILEHANPRMKQAVKNMLNTNHGGDATNETKPAPHSNVKQAAAAKALKGVSSSLLEKIRNREREKLLNEMTRSPAESKKLQMTKRMPEFIKIIRNMMVADKKIALPLATVVDRVSNSVQKMTSVDTEAHIRLLTTLLPHWLKIHKLSHSITEYVKIEKSADINLLLSEMDDIIKKLSS